MTIGNYLAGPFIRSNPWEGYNAGDRMTPLFGAPDIDKLQAQGDIPQLIKALRHSQSEVRKAAAKALGALGDKAAVPALVQLLSDEPRTFAEKREARAKRKGYLEADLALADEYKAHIAVCQEAARSLGDLHDSRAVERLIAALNTGDHWLRCSITAALIDIGDLRAVEPLYRAYGHEAYGSKGRQWVYKDKFLASFHLEDDKTVRGAIYWILRKGWDHCVEIGAPAVEPLITLLDNPDREVCRSVIETLTRIGDVRAVEPLIDTMQHYHDFTTRCQAARALGCFGDARAAKPLEELLAQFRGLYGESGMDLQLAITDALAAIRKVKPIAEG